MRHLLPYPDGKIASERHVFLSPDLTWHRPGCLWRIVAWPRIELTCKNEFFAQQNSEAEMTFLSHKIWVMVWRTHAFPATNLTGPLPPQYILDHMRLFAFFPTHGHRLFIPSRVNQSDDYALPFMRPEWSPGSHCEFHSLSESKRSKEKWYSEVQWDKVKKGETKRSEMERGEMKVEVKKVGWCCKL